MAYVNGVKVREGSTHVRGVRLNSVPLIITSNCMVEGDKSIKDCEAVRKIHDPDFIEQNVKVLLSQDWGGEITDLVIGQVRTHVLEYNLDHIPKDVVGMRAVQPAVKCGGKKVDINYTKAFEYNGDINMSCYYGRRKAVLAVDSFSKTIDCGKHFSDGAEMADFEGGFFNAERSRENLTRNLFSKYLKRDVTERAKEVEDETKCKVGGIYFGMLWMHGVHYYDLEMVDRKVGLLLAATFLK